MPVARLSGIREGVVRGLTFLSEVQAELGRVHWPGRKETYAATVVVIVISLITAVYLGLIDLTVSRLIQALLQ